MYTSPKDFPEIGRLNTVHHEDVPYRLVNEHYYLACRSSVCYMEFRKAEFLIRIKGYYCGTWYPSWKILYKTFDFRRAKERFYRVCDLIFNSHRKLDGESLQQQLEL